MKRTSSTPARGEASAEPFTLHSERLGPLPVINYFLNRLGVPSLFARFVPTHDPRSGLPAAKGLGVLLRSLLVEREPIYRQQETVLSYAPAAFNLAPEEVRRVGDDAVGRALDRLFDADRGSLLTELVVAAREVFDLGTDELHNDSTTVRFSGQYPGRRGQSIRGRRLPWITYGHSKDHRPDLKQLLYVLTTTTDGGVPLQFRCLDGNTNDSRTHIETWEALRAIAGRDDFLYVADSKLCSEENMDYIDRRGGRFITVLPRSRREDSRFRQWLQTHEPTWEVVRNRPNPRRKSGARDVWRVYRPSTPSMEGWPLFWVSSSLLRLRQLQSRDERIARAEQELDLLRQKLAGRRPRLRSVTQVQQRAEAILRRQRVKAYLKVRVFEEEEYLFRQEHRGRPGPETRYRRRVRRHVRLAWETIEDAIAYDRKSDGMYPLLTNDRHLTGRQVLEAHKRQPTIEKRFEQFKAVHQVAPVFLKNKGRIQALFFLYFIGLLVQALIERQLRQSMLDQKIGHLPIYPEERLCKRPTALQVFRLLSLTTRHTLLRGNRPVQVFAPELTDLQRQVLRLLGVPLAAYGVQGRPA
jgi:transposase